jgi:hypothetical protein
VQTQFLIQLLQLAVVLAVVVQQAILVAQVVVQQAIILV